MEKTSFTTNTAAVTGAAAAANTMGTASTAAAAPVKKVLYFKDCTPEQWVGNDSAVVELVDNTKGHDHYKMSKVDSTTWKAEVLEGADNITFNRLSPDKTIQWNSWSAGGRGSADTYYASGHEFGHWGSAD